MNDPTLRRPMGSRLRLWAIAILLIIIYIWAFRGMQFEGLQGTVKVSLSLYWTASFIPTGRSSTFLRERIYCAGYWIRWSFQCSEPSCPHLSVFRSPFGRPAI